MFKLGFYYILLLLMISCSSNIFEETADKTTDKARYYQAKKLLDQKKYDDSLALFALLTPAFTLDAAVQKTWAGALAGRCGLEFIPFFNNVNKSSNFTSGFLQIIRNTFQTISTHSSDCITADQKMRTYGTSTDDLFLLVLNLAKLGTILKETSDTDADGVTDALFDACANTVVAHGITDSDVTAIVMSFAVLVRTISLIVPPSQIDCTDPLNAGDSNCIFKNFETNICNGNCSTFTESQVTANNILQMRNVINSSTTGLGGVNLICL